jgi:streptomycin 6-kinase
VVKVLWRHTDAEHEADALRGWDGDGAVQLRDARDLDAETTALLIERCQPGTTLRSLPEPEQDLVTAGLLPRLWRELPAGHQFRPLKAMCERWADEFDEKRDATGSALDPGLVREAMALFRELPLSAEREMLAVHRPARLRHIGRRGRAVAGDRSEPLRGDPTYDALQQMLNRKRLYADPQSLVHRMADCSSSIATACGCGCSPAVPESLRAGLVLPKSPFAANGHRNLSSLLTPAIRIHRAPLESAGLMRDLKGSMHHPGPLEGCHTGEGVSR